MTALAQEMGTHTHASVQGWSWPATRLDLDVRRHLERTLNYWRGEKEDVFRLPMPWPDPNAVPDEERERLAADLERRSAFRDR